MGAGGTDLFKASHIASSQNVVNVVDKWVRTYYFYPFPPSDLKLEKAVNSEVIQLFIGYM